MHAYSGKWRENILNILSLILQWIVLIVMASAPVKGMHFLNQNCSDWKKLLIINFKFWHFQEHTQHKVREITGQWKAVFSHILCSDNIQKHIPNTVEHLRWNIFMKIVNGHAFIATGHTDIAVSNELRYFEGREIWSYLLCES